MIRKIILTEAFGIFALSLLLIPQVAHTVFVFKANSHYLNPWFSWPYAVGVDLAILIFTVKGWLKTSVIFFIGTLAHNVIYQFFPESVWSALLICIMLSGSIFLFTHLFYKENEATSLKEVERITPKLVKQGAQVERVVEAGVRIELLPYRCPQCGTSFKLGKQLNGHISAHKSKGEWEEDTYGNWEKENENRVHFCKVDHIFTKEEKETKSIF